MREYGTPIGLLDARYVNVTGDTMTGLFASTKKGDQFLLTTDASPYREGVWDITTSGDLYTLLGSLAMKYSSHNVALDTATGNFLGRDETEGCQLTAWTESGVQKTYSAASASAGTVPTWILRDSFDIMTGNRFIYGHVAFGETATILSNTMLNIAGSVQGSNAAGLKFTLGFITTSAIQTQSAFNMLATVNTGAILPQISGIIAEVKNSSTAAWGASAGAVSPAVFRGTLSSTAGSASLGNWASIFQARKGTFSGGKPAFIIGHESQDLSDSGTITSCGFYSFVNTYGAWFLKGLISGMVLDGDGAGADLVLGDGQDASIYYDGTNLIVNPKLVGTGRMDVLGNLIHDGYYGNFYQNEVTTTITISVANTWYLITGNTANLNNGMTFASDQLTISANNGGKYMVNWSCSFYDGAGTQNFEIGTAVNGTVDTTSVGHNTTKGANDNVHTSGTTILNLAAGDTVDLRIRNTGSTNNPTITHLTFTLVWVGK